MIKKIIKKQLSWIDKVYPYCKIYVMSTLAVASSITLWQIVSNGTTQLASIILLIATLVTTTKETKDVTKKHIFKNMKKNKQLFWKIALIAIISLIFVTLFTWLYKISKLL